MPKEESIEVVNSENESSTPSPTPDTVAPTEPKEPAKPAEPEAKLYDLPDGRKVDAETLSREWKENFYPDYTRKSQELAKAKEGVLPTEKSTNPYADPNYVPQSYEEIIKTAEDRALQRIEEREQKRLSEQKAIEDSVTQQIETLRKSEPNLDENALFLHATKYGFRDLMIAHQNMKDMSALAKNVQKTTVQNIAKRADPVSSSPGATGARPDPNSFVNARDFLRSLK